MALASPTSAAESIGWLRRLRERLDPRFVLGLGYAVAVLLTLAAVYLTARAPGAGRIGAAGRTMLAVVLCNLVLILALAAWASSRRP